MIERIMLRQLLHHDQQAEAPELAKSSRRVRD